MPSQSDELARYVTMQLKRLADPAKAPAMAGYMKTSQPFFGVPTPIRTTMLKQMGDRFAPPDQRSYARSVMALWKLPHREERYCAITFARKTDPRAVRAFLTKNRGRLSNLSYAEGSKHLARAGSK
jgi:DNA alkylation repair enzyme